MPAIAIGLNPILTQIGPVPLSWHGIFMVVAVASGTATAALLARGAGLSGGAVRSLVWWALPGGIAGARLLHVLDDLRYYSADPWQMIAFWEGGFSLYGALLGGTIVAIAYAYFKRMKVAAYADLAVPGLLVAQIVARFADVIDGSAYGTPTSLPWAVTYTHPNAAGTTPLNISVHPAAAYEMLWDALILVFVVKLWRHPRTPGQLFLGYVCAYSVGRFVISFWRQDGISAIGLQQAQIVALLLTALTLPALFYIRRKKTPPRERRVP